MGEGHGKVSMFALQKIKREREVSHFDQVAMVMKPVYKLYSTVCASHRVSASCRGLAAPRQPSLQEPGPMEKHKNIMHINLFMRNFLLYGFQIQ